MTERTPPKSQQQRLTILKSAAAAFRRRGYHGASVDQIARALGMTKGNLYYYFRNKEEILFFCHDYSLDLLLSTLTRVEAEGGTAAERLQRVLVAFVHMILDELHGTALTLDVDALSAAHRRKVVKKRDHFERALRQLVEQGVTEGAFVPGDTRLRTFAMLGAMNWITRWYDPRGSKGTDEIARTFAGFLLGGLRG